jgi:leucyl-tRNA synthetase
VDAVRRESNPCRRTILHRLLNVPDGKPARLRHKMVADADMPVDALMALVKSDRRVKELLAGKTIVKEIAVPGRLVNFVVRE